MTTAERKKLELAAARLRADYPAADEAGYDAGFCAELSNEPPMQGTRKAS